LVLLSLLQEPDLLYKTREDQSQLLQQVLAASDVDADEERIPGEGPRTGPAVCLLGSVYYLQGLCAVLVHFYLNKSNLLN
jgi:DNA excision repair protein ERCC-3